MYLQFETFLQPMDVLRTFPDRSCRGDEDCYDDFTVWRGAFALQFQPHLVNHRRDDSHCSLVAQCIVFTLQLVDITFIAMFGCLHCDYIDSIWCTVSPISFANIVKYSFGVTTNEDS